MKYISRIGMLLYMLLALLACGYTQDASNIELTGAVFAMTNRTSGNAIVRYHRNTDGTLQLLGSTSTQGRGIGTDLDTQGGLILSHDNHFLYASNAGSDDVTVFAVNGAIP